MDVADDIGATWIPARDSVLSIPELYETIILYLPIRDILLRVPLVCKEWRDAVTSSPRLQQALFLRPVPGEPLRLTETGWAKSESDPHAYTVLANPFYDRLCKLPIPEATPKKQLDALTRPEASWRRMLVCQPPIKENWCPATCRRSLRVDHLCIVDLICERCRACNLVRAIGIVNIKVEGSAQWMTPECGNEVRRLVRPKAWWLLPAGSAGAY